MPQNGDQEQNRVEAIGAILVDWAKNTFLPLQLERARRAGRAGALAGLPFCTRLHDFMTQVRRGSLPNDGDFCGYCYSPLRYPPLGIDPRTRQQSLPESMVESLTELKMSAGDTHCPECFASFQAYPIQRRIPNDVLTIYALRDRWWWCQ